MLPHRISAKLFVRQPFLVDPAEFVSLFHRWIQEESVAGLLIDVADYKHVHQGPGIILAGFEGDYAFDFRDGRPGLQYSRKRRGWRDEESDGDEGERFRSRLHLVLQHLFHAAAVLESEQHLSSRVAFRTDQVEILFLDRLQTPNTTETFLAVRQDIVAALTTFMPEAAIELQQAYSDARYPLVVRAHLTRAPRLRVLVQRLADPV